MGRYLGQVDQEQAPPGSGDRRLIEALQQNWLAEIEGGHTYHMLAEQEHDPTRREVLLELAEAEERHASNWAQRLQQLGAETPVPAGSLGLLARDRVIKGGGTMAVIRKPVIAFFFFSGYTAIMAAAIVSLLAHFAVGAAKTLVTARSWWSSGLEMTIVGAVEGVVTYLVGLAFAGL